MPFINASKFLYMFINITMCACISCQVMSFCGCLSVCVLAITWQKIDQAGEPETFFNFDHPLYNKVVPVKPSRLLTMIVHDYSVFYMG